MNTHEWIMEFAAAHTARFQTWAGKPGGWPRVLDSRGAPTPEALIYFGPWAGRFAERGVTLDVAQLASANMAASGDSSHPGKHLDVLMKHVDMVWANQESERRATGGPAHSLDAARHAARNCPECCGMGYTVRPYWVRKLDNQGADHGQECNYTMFCLCVAGEYLAANFAAKGENAAEAVRAMKARTRRLAQYPELWDRTLYPWPACWPLNPVPRTWPLESGWITDRYGEAPCVPPEDGVPSQEYSELRLRVTGTGPRPAF